MMDRWYTWLRMRPSDTGGQAMKIGILGAGHIARKVSRTLVKMEEIECWAVAARSLDRAQEFAETFGFSKAYGSYEQMLSDPQIQLVYVATPHSCHFPHIMQCLEAGKHVLCEKAFTLNASQARKIARYAKEKGLFVAEAIWTRYMPSRAMIDEIIQSGIIGKPNTLTANLSYVVDYKPRIMDPALGGGALLDIGVYGINFALMHFGKDIRKVESSVRMTDTGVDAMETITIHYEDGRMAVLTHSIYARSDRMGCIHGDQGYIVIENINNPSKITVYGTDDCPVAVYGVPGQISGYEYEFLECRNSIRNGKTESDFMPLAETVYAMEFMDALRKQWGMVFPGEQE